MSVLTRPRLGGLKLRPATLSVVATLASRAPMTALELAREMGTDRHAMHACLDRLLDAGLVLRHPAARIPQNRYTTYVWFAAPLPR